MPIGTPDPLDDLLNLFPSPSQAPVQSPAGPAADPLDELMNLFAKPAPEQYIAAADPRKVAEYQKVAETLSRTPPLGLGEHATAFKIPEQDQSLFLAIAEQQYKADQTMKKAGYGARLATSAIQGAVDFGMPLAKMTGAVPSLDPVQERFKQELMGLREGIDPTIRPDTNMLGRGVQQVGRMAVPMVQSIGAGKALGGAAKLAGMGNAATSVATAVGTSGSFLPQTADQTYTSLIGEGVDPSTAKKITAVSAPIEAAIESIIPDPFEGYGAAFKGSARQVAARLLKQYTVNYTKELGEEGLQAVVNETAMEVGRQMDTAIPDKGFGNILMRGVTEMREAALPLALMVAPGAAVGGASAARKSAERGSQLESLREFRAAESKNTLTDEEVAYLQQRFPDEVAAFASAPNPSRSAFDRSGMPKPLKELGILPQFDSVRGRQAIWERLRAQPETVAEETPETPPETQRNATVTQQEVQNPPVNQPIPPQFDATTTQRNATEDPEVLWVESESTLDATQPPILEADAADKSPTVPPTAPIRSNAEIIAEYQSAVRAARRAGKTPPAASDEYKAALAAQMKAIGKADEDVTPSIAPPAAAPPTEVISAPPVAPEPIPQAQQSDAEIQSYRDALKASNDKFQREYGWMLDANGNMLPDAEIEERRADAEYRILEQMRIDGAKEAATSAPPTVQPVVKWPKQSVGADEPPIPDGHVRMYHGGTAYEGGPRWLTHDRAYAQGYADKSEGAGVSFVDIPANSPLLSKSFDDTDTPNTPSPPVAFEAPEDVAAKLTPIAKPTPPVPPVVNKGRKKAGKEAPSESAKQPAQVEEWKVVTPENINDVYNGIEDRSVEIRKDAKTGELVWRKAVKKESPSPENPVSKGKAAPVSEPAEAVSPSRSAGEPPAVSIEERITQEFVGNVNAKIDEWVSNATNNGTRPIDKNWERKAVKRFAESELSSVMIGKQYGKRAAAKIAISKAESFDDLRQAIGKLQEVPPTANTGKTAPVESAPVAEAAPTPEAVEPVVPEPVVRPANAEPRKPPEKAIPAYVRVTPEKDSPERTELRNRSQELRERELEAAKPLRAAEDELGRTRRNSTKKRAEIQGRINHFQGIVGASVREQREIGNQLRLIAIEDWLESPQSYEHYLSGMAELHQIKATTSRDKAEAERRSIESRRRKGERPSFYFAEELDKDAHNEQVRSDEFATELLDRMRSTLDAMGTDLNKSEKENVINDAYRDFDIASRDSLEEKLRKRAAERKALRKGHRAADIDKMATLPEESKQAYKQRLEEIAERGGEGWWEQSDAVVAEASAEHDKAIAKDKEDRFEAARIAKEEADIARAGEMKAKRQRSREQGVEAKYWSQLKTRSKDIKTTDGETDVRVEDKGEPKKLEAREAEIIDDNWAITEKAEWVDKGQRGEKREKSYSLTHRPSGLALTGASSSAYLKQLWQLVLDMGLDTTKLSEDATVDDIAPFKRAIQAWDKESLEHLNDDEKAALLKTVVDKPTTVNADIVLDSHDLGVYDDRLNRTGRDLAKKMAAEVPEFAYNPVFTVNDQKKLVFRDGYKFVFPSEAFNVDESELKAGQTVGINLEDLGIERATPEDVIKGMFAPHGYAVRAAGKGGRGLRTTIKGQEVALVGEGESWSAQSSNDESQGIAKSILDRIRWTQAGQDANLPQSKGKAGPLIGRVSTSPPFSINAPQAVPVPQKTNKGRKTKPDSNVAPEPPKPVSGGDANLQKAIGIAKELGRLSLRNLKNHMGPSVTMSEVRRLMSDLEKAGILSAETRDQSGELDENGDWHDYIGDKEPATPEPPKPAKKRSERKSEEAAAAKKALDEKMRKLIDPTEPSMGLNPKKIAQAVDAAVAALEYGYIKFDELVSAAVESLGDAAVRELAPYLEEAARIAGFDDVTTVDEVLGKMTPAQVEQAVEQSLQPSGDDLTGIKKAVVNELRAQVGLPEMQGSTPQTVEEWAEQARATLAADPQAAVRLVNDLAVNPRAIDQHDAMLLQFHYRGLANKLRPQVDAYFDAVDSKDSARIAAAARAVEAARAPMTEFEEIIHPMKESWGRTGVALQQLLRRDFSLEAILRRGREKNHGKPLTAEQTAELTAMAKQLEEMQSELDKERKQREELERELASRAQHQQVVDQAKSKGVVKKTVRRQKAEERVASAIDALRKKLAGRAGAGAPVDVLPEAIEAAKAYLDLGVVRFGEFLAHIKQQIGSVDEKVFRKAWDQVAADNPPVGFDMMTQAELSRDARRIQKLLVMGGMTDRDQVIDAVHKIMQEELPEFTRRDTMDALSRYGQFQEQSQEPIAKTLRDMNAEILKLSQIDQQEIALKRVEELRAQGKTDEEIGNALQRENLLVASTGLVRDNPSDTVRNLTKIYNENKKSIPASSEDRAGLLQTSLSSIERSLANRIRDLNWELTHGELIVSTPRQRPTSERIQQLEAERDALLKAHREMFPPKSKALTDEQRLAAALSASEQAIQRLEQQLEKQDFDTNPRTKLSSPELDAARARLAQLRAQRKALQALELSEWEGEGGGTGKLKPRSMEEVARRTYEASLRKRIADYHAMLAAGDFSPKPKKQPRTLSPSELKLKREMEDVRHKVLEKFAEYHLANLHGIAWGADKLKEAAHLSRALMTSFDMSALLRQGGLAAFGHPVLAKRALAETIADIARTFDKSKAFNRGEFQWDNIEQFLTGLDSRQAEFEFMHKLNDGPRGVFRQQAKLNLPATDEVITKQEEAFQGRWGKLVPGVAISSRMYTMILNKLRADLFDQMVDNLGRGGQVTMDEAKVIANFVNVATGRSDLGRFNGWASLLNTVFFAPRYVASRFQYLAMPFYLPFQGGIKNNWRVKRAILNEFARTFGGLATVLGGIGLLSWLLWDDDDEDRPRIELDPRSTDFLKVRIGETRVDFLAGLSQAFVLSARMTMGSLGYGAIKSSISGKVRKFGEGFNPQNQGTLLAHFARTKLAPIPGAVTTYANGMESVVGQKETPLSLAQSMVFPMSLGEVAKTIEARGIPLGAALSVLSLLGAGMNTYGPKTEYAAGTPEERTKQIEKDLKSMQWDDKDQPAYSEFLTPAQLQQFHQRHREKRGSVVFHANYHGNNEDELKTRDKNREHLKEMQAEGVSLADARALLRDYYQRRDSSGVRGQLTDEYRKRLSLLNSVYQQLDAGAEKNLPKRYIKK